MSRLKPGPTTEATATASGVEWVELVGSGGFRGSFGFAQDDGMGGVGKESSRPFDDVSIT